MSSRGFSLIEVLMATLVLSIGLLSAGAFVSYTVRRSTEARRITTAQMVGNQVLERLRTEVRYDVEPWDRTGLITATGSSKGGLFTMDNAWAADRLPYEADETMAPTAGVRSCNPQPTVADGQTYDVGPFMTQFEGNTYYICTRIVLSAIANLPTMTMEGTVKVMWRTPLGDYSARWVTGLLMNGR